MRYAALVFCAATPSASADWWDEDWPCRVRAVVNGAVIREDLEDFPVCVRFPASERLLEAPDGSGLRVIDENGRLLPVEVVSWGPEGAEAYVRLPRIQAGAAQHVDLYFGNAMETAAPSGRVWRDSERIVLHLGGNLRNAIDGEETGRIAGAVTLGENAVFDGGRGYIELTGEALGNLDHGFTIVMRVRLGEGPQLQTLAAGQNAEGSDWFNFGLKRPHTLHTNNESAGRVVGELNTEGLRPGTWHGVAVTYDVANRRRATCIDGLVYGEDSLLTGPMEIETLRVGRGLLHFEPWQFSGAIDEFRLMEGPRSEDGLRAAAASLAERSPMVSAGPVQELGQPIPAPRPVQLIAPADGLLWKKRSPVAFQWTPAAWAETYALRLFAPGTAQPVAEHVLDAATEIEFARKELPAETLTWRVVARGPGGASYSQESRNLGLYAWEEGPAMPKDNAAEPQMDAAPAVSYDLGGYFRRRLDKTIDRYLLDTPESSPAILQVLRDRDKRPVRDPLVPWAGEFAGKYLTSAQLIWRLTRDPELKANNDAFARALIACQADNGYLGPFPEEARLTGSNWDVWGHYHCLYGLMLYYEDTDHEPALAACEKAADLLFETFGPGGPSLQNDGAGGQMNMAVAHGLVLLHRKTGRDRYLDLANYIVHDAFEEPGAGNYLEAALAGQEMVEFPQHRWEALHDIQALGELHWLTGEADYKKAFTHIWHSAVRGDRHSTGGFTSGEGLQGSPYHQAAIETCCTIAWLALSVDMLRMTGDSRVADEIEWSTLNSALGAIPYSGRACAYNVPMDGTRCYGVELPWQAPKAGPDLNCCAVNAPRALGMVAEWGLMRRGGGLAINWYGPGTMSAELGGNPIAFWQETAYPVENRVRITVDAGQNDRFPLYLRIPFWSRETAVDVNGEPVGAVEPGTYAAVDREWGPGDVIEITFDFGLRYWLGEAECADKVALFRGPLLLAYDARYNDIDPMELPQVDWRGVELEPLEWDGPLPPWYLARLSGPGVDPFTVCDFSSAGQTGNHYRSWLPGAALPEAPGNVRDIKWLRPGE